MEKLPTLRNLFLVGSLALLTACGSSADTAASLALADMDDEVTLVSADAANDDGRDDVASSPGGLTDAEVTTLLFVREEEKLARDVYLTLHDQWGVPVFENIATRSEQQHLDVMGDLVNTYNLVDPVMDDTVGVFTDPAILALYEDLVMRGSFSLLDGLKVGGFIEEFDINDLQEAIDEAEAGSGPDDVIEAYENLMCGSRNHLRAFVSQYENNSGVAYEAQVMPQATVDAIVATPEEQCGQ